MNDEIDARTDGLNGLLKDELAAVSSYQRALRSVDAQAVVEGARFLRIASEHQRTVAALQAAVREMGGIPASEAGSWGGEALLHDTTSVRELLRGEETGLTRYEAANEEFDGDARDLVTLELIPRQRKHIAELAAILTRLE